MFTRVASGEMPEQSTTTMLGAGREAASVHAAIDFFFPRQAAGSRVERVAGGFSGSQVLRVVLPSGAAWALKQFPAACDAERAVWLHRVIRHLRAAPLRWIPEVASGAGGSVWRDGSGGLWEMLSWMPGQPQAAPSGETQQVMIEAVGALHTRAASLAHTPAGMRVSQAVGDRLEQCRRLLRDPWDGRYGQTRSSCSWKGAAQGQAARLAAAVRLASEILQADGEQALRRVLDRQPRPVPCLPVLRDLTADHFLLSETHEPGDFVGGGHGAGPPAVTGLIDFHAARVDSPACDLARLLGSWNAGLPSQEAIDQAVAWYRPQASCGVALPQDPRQLAALIGFFAATGVVLGLDNWFRWLLQEERQFPDGEAVLARVETHLGALAAAFRRLATMPALV